MKQKRRNKSCSKLIHAIGCTSHFASFFLNRQRVMLLSCLDLPCMMSPRIKWFWAVFRFKTLLSFRVFIFACVAICWFFLFSSLHLKTGSSYPMVSNQLCDCHTKQISNEILLEWMIYYFRYMAGRAWIRPLNLNSYRKTRDLTDKWYCW